MNKTITLCIFLLIIALIGIVIVLKEPVAPARTQGTKGISKLKITPSTAPAQNPLTIQAMQQKSYPGSMFTIVQTVSTSPSFTAYIASYISDGLTLFGLLTVPTGTMPSGGWPAILFNHGYIPPSQYSTTDSYAVMIDPLASAGYIVFVPDYRGNGKSPGTPQQIYISPSYLTDSMNALASLKQYKSVNPDKIGVFGHSMGGNVTLHELVISNDFKAAEIMAGVVGTEGGILTWWDTRFANHTIVGNDLQTYYVIQQMVAQNQTPATNSGYWNEIDPTMYLQNITTPIQIQVGSKDTEVPEAFSTTLYTSLQDAGKTVSFHEYPGADHNLAPDTQAAMAQAILFFNSYLK